MFDENLNKKQANGGMSDKGKLKADEWNKFINDLITELNNRIVSIILNGTTYRPTNGSVNLGHIQVAIDSELSTSSHNAVRNSVITSALNALQSDKASVQELQQAVSALNAVQTSMETKVGHLDYENGKIKFYDYNGGTQLGEITLTGTSYTVQLSTTTPSIFTVLRDAVAAYIDVTPTSLASEIGQQSLPFIEDYTWEISIDNGSGTFVPRMSGTCFSGQSIHANVRSYLSVSNAEHPNRIRITVTGLESGAVKSAAFSAIVTTLSLSSNFSWERAWVEGNDYGINGLLFSGNMPKVLHVKIDNDDEQEYTNQFSSGDNYDTSTYTFLLTADKFPGTTGIHTVEIWMTATGVETQHFLYNIMCVESEDVGNVQMACINEFASPAVNYEEQTLFKFAVYGGTSATITVTANDSGTTIPVVVGQTLTVEAGTQQSFVYSLEIESESSGMTMTYNVVSGEIGQTKTVPIDNSNSFAAVGGAVIYINAAYRSNLSADRETIINEAAEAEVSEFNATWENFAWANDGWAFDPDGNRCLAVLAGSSVEIPDITLTKADTMSVTYEFKFRCSNIADYDTPILSLMNTSTYNANSTSGLILFPTKIQILSSNARQHVVQSVNLYEDSILHVMVVFQRRYAGMAYNLCHIYVNGIRQAVFLYGGDGSFGRGSLKIGQASSDFYLYMFRIYESTEQQADKGVLNDAAVLTNLLNQLGSSTGMNRNGVRESNAIIDNSKIDYELAKAAGYNCMVVEMAEGAYLPDLDHSSGGNSTLWLEYGAHPEWNVKIENAPIDGQGTTSMKYYRWNLRWKLAKAKDGNPASIWTYADGTTSTTSGYFDGKNNHPKVKKITAKKNVASSMQGHKIGATAMYDDMFTACRLKEGVGISDSTRDDGTYSFIGLYTCGPDKGDGDTFGYDKTNYPSFLSLEGPNHNPLGTRFLHPWVDAYYDATKKEETLKFGGEEAWDVDAAPWDSDDATHRADMQNLLEAEWKPAYDIVYFCSPYVRSLNEIGMTLQQLNAVASTWRSASDVLTTRRNEVLTLYDSSYNLIYYRNSTSQYEVLSSWTVKEYSSGSYVTRTCTNILDYLGNYLSTASPTTAQIIAARKAKFFAEAGYYWDLRGCCFHEAFCELIGAKDNHAKNTYPFKLKTLDNGGRWTWREDDLDSIMATDNNGQSTAHYGSEVGDVVNNIDVYQGSSSAFWTLINECFGSVEITGTDNVPTVGGLLDEILAALKAKCTSMGIANANTHEAVFKMFSYYFWEHSAGYFPIIAYAHDSKFAYIDAWTIGLEKNPPVEAYNGVKPLNQALGTQLEAEKQWVERRIVNISSKYHLDGFRGSGNDGLGSLEFTPKYAFTFNLIPAIEMYPSGNLGGGSNENCARTAAGATRQLTASSTGDTIFYLKALDWITELGDLKGLQLSPRGGAENIYFAVSGKRLRKLKVGDEVAANVDFNATSLTVSGQSLEEIDARNTNITDPISLVNCPRLRKAYFEGCKTTSLILPAGSKLYDVSFPSQLTTLFFDTLPLLYDANLVIPQATLGTIQNYYFRNCDHIDAFAILKSILETPNNSLHFITIIWNQTIEITADELGLLYQIIQTFNPSTGEGYGNVEYENGQISSGTGHANLQGTLNLKGFYYNDIYDAVHAAFPNITFICDESPYIRFEDEEVERICSVTWGNYHEVITVDNGDDTVTVTTNFVRMRNTTVASRTQESVVTRAKTESDVAGTVKVKHGITLAQAALVSSIGTTFQGRTLNRLDLRIFPNLKSLANYALQNTTASPIIIPSWLTTWGYYSLLRAKTVVSFVETPPSGSHGATSTNYYSRKEMYVPDDSVEAYKAAYNNATSYAYTFIHPISECPYDL